MLTRRSLGACLAFGLFAASGCLGAGTSPTSPTGSGFTVEASVLSASLASDCPSAGFAAARCGAPSSDAGAADSACGYCRQSTLQLALNAGPGAGTVEIAVVSVRLIDAASGAVLGTLSSREPQSWTGTGYVAWDSVLEASESLRASYKLSAPNWVALAGSGTAFALYSRRFVLEVTLTVGGVPRVIRSSEITREPEVVT